MILVLAGVYDDTADRFSDYVRACGEPCVVVHEPATAALNVSIDRNGHANVEIREKATGQLVKAVFNRGTMCWSETNQASFGASERLASWWSALASFSGPVINRPSRKGFVPDIAVSGLVPAVPGLCSARRHISTVGHSAAQTLRVNVHRLRDGQYLGESGKVNLDMCEVYLYTTFDPLLATHLIIAGDQILDLNPLADPHSTPIVQRLLDEVKHRNATFALIVIERDEIAVRLLHTTIAPLLHHYRHLETAVHKSLLRYLKG